MIKELLHGKAMRDLICAPGEYKPYPPRSDRAAWESIPDRDALIAWGEKALAGYPPTTATQYLAYVRTGSREVMEAPYFERRRLLIGAVMAECITDSGRYTDAVIDGLWHICEESSWSVSAHNYPDPLPDVTDPVIDLFAAQTAQIVAYTLYFLRDKLDSVTPILTRRAELEMEERIFRPFLHRSDLWWIGDDGRRLNNWTPWVLSNVSESVLLLEKDPFILGRDMDMTVKLLDRYLSFLPSDGGCDEGCSYWNMAGGTLLDCLETIYRATGGAVSAFDIPLVREFGLFPLRAHITGDRFWNFADCNSIVHPDGERLYAYGERIGSDALKALGTELSACCDYTRGLPTQMNRILSRQFHPCPPVSASTQPDRVFLPELQVFAKRCGSWYAAIKGGNNAESHNHNDIGSFIIYLDNRPLFADAGNAPYTAKTFGPERYTIWNTRSANHNLPLINGAEQTAGEKYRAEISEVTEDSICLEIRGAWPEDTAPRTLKREFTVSSDGVTIRDIMETRSPVPCSWVFITAQKTAAEGKTLRVGDAVMTFPEGASVTVKPLAPEAKYVLNNYPDGLSRIVLSYPANTSFDMTFSIRKKA